MQHEFEPHAASVRIEGGGFHHDNRVFAETFCFITDKPWPFMDGCADRMSGMMSVAIAMCCYMGLQFLIQFTDAKAGRMISIARSSADFTALNCFSNPLVVLPSIADAQLSPQ